MESKPMTTSEPTTGELIEALRCDGVIKPCEGCFFAFQIENCAAMGCRTDDMFGLAADRLESQQREIERLKPVTESDDDVIGVETAIMFLESVREILPQADGLIDVIRSLHGSLEECSGELVAEKARADAAAKDIDRIAETHSICHLCDFVDMIGCCHKNHCDGLNLFRLRGEKGKATE